MEKKSTSLHNKLNDIYKKKQEKNQKCLDFPDMTK